MLNHHVFLQEAHKEGSICLLGETGQQCLHIRFAIIIIFYIIIS